MIGTNLRTSSPTVSHADTPRLAQVNKKVGQTLASGIETAEATTSQAKETVRE